MFRCKFCGDKTQERPTTKMMCGDEAVVVFYCSECGSLEPYVEEKQSEV